MDSGCKISDFGLNIKLSQNYIKHIENLRNLGVREGLGLGKVDSGDSASNTVHFPWGFH